MKSKSTLALSGRSEGYHGQNVKPRHVEKTGNWAVGRKPTKSKGHFLSQTGTYRSWHSMRHRCLNPKCKGYNRYGGRGITICREWMDFLVFLRDMGERPEGKTLDRIDNNGNYEPGNCRWATRKEQARNMRTNRFVTCRGLRMISKDAAVVCGFNENTLDSFLYKHPNFNGDVSELFFPPLRKLNVEQVRLIRASRLSSQKMALQLGVSKSLIKAVRRREVWRHIIP